MAKELQDAAALGNVDLATSVDTWGVPGLTITSFHLAQLQRSVEILPHVRHSWLLQEITAETVETAVAAGVKQLCPRADAVTGEAVQLALAAGLSVRAWLIKAPEVRCVQCFFLAEISVRSPRKLFIYII